MNKIACNSIMLSCTNGIANNATGILKRATGPTDPYTEILDTWKTAGYDLTNVEWINYYPDKLFVDWFAREVNATPRYAWVSKLMPGKTAPWHWDVNDRTDEWLADGELVRWSCFLDRRKFRFGHVFLVEDKCYYNQEQGTIIKWDNWNSYHAKSNSGSDPFYMMHFLGKPND
jgi:hypothetical protein